MRDVAAPVLVRFPDILDNRIEKVSCCFRQADVYKRQRESLGGLSGNGVGIRIQHVPVSIVCQRSHHGNHTLMNEVCQESIIHLDVYKRQCYD